MSMGARYGRRVALGKAMAGFAVLPALAQTPVRVLMLGDSITAGYGLPPGQGLVPRLQAALEASGRQVRLIDAGVSGDTTAGGLARIDWSLAENPQAAVVALGGNDGLRGLPPANSRANLAGILDRLAARNIPVLLAGMLAPPNLGADYGREFASIYTTLAAERPGIILYPFLLEGVAGDVTLNQPDGIHPNPAGVAEMVRRMLPVTQTLLDRIRS
ncbi:MAG: arylesterase [Rubritepida sp.]|nr:arylesterase [Rubritepida sp.]